MMGVMSVSFDKWFKAHKIEGAHKLKSVISVNTRPLPQNLEDVKLLNESIGKLNSFTHIILEKNITLGLLMIVLI
jgi:hypothetical protein